MPTADDARREILRKLIARTGGHAATVAKFNLSPSQASYLSQLTAAGSDVPIKERSAANWETRLSLPDGTLVQPEGVQPAASRGTDFLPGFEPISIPVLKNSASMGQGSDQLPADVVVGRLTVSPQWVARTLKPLTSIENLRFIHGYGDSMEPTFTDGDILLVDAGVRNCDVDGIYVLSANERLFIKRVTEKIEGGHDITSDNPKVKTMMALDGSRPVDVLGRVIWVWNGKKI